MEAPIVYKSTKYGNIYINREGLECMAMLRCKLGEAVMEFLDEVVCGCSVERSFVEDVTFRGRPIITEVDVERGIGFYLELR